MNIAIVGSGALVLYYGARLQYAGDQLHFLLRRDYQAITANGLQVYSIHGDFELPQVNGYRLAEEIGSVDLVIVGLKTFANQQYEPLITPLLGADTKILTLQNGLGNEEQLAALFGAERILGGVAFLCSNRGEPGVVHHLGAGRIIMGEYQPHDFPALETLAARFRQAGIECQATPDLKRARWEKLVWNIPFNGLCALLQQSVDMLLAQPACRELVRELMLEVIGAANAQGLSRPIAEEFAQEMLDFTDAMGGYRPSMQIDREEGRQLELDAIFSTPLAYGRQQGAAMPRVAMLSALLRQVV